MSQQEGFVDSQGNFIEPLLTPQSSKNPSPLIQQNQAIDVTNRRLDFSSGSASKATFYNPPQQFQQNQTLGAFGQNSFQQNLQILNQQRDLASQTGQPQLMF